MKLKNKTPIVLFVIIFCFSLYGCSKPNSGEDEVDSVTNEITSTKNSSPEIEKTVACDTAIDTTSVESCTTEVTATEVAASEVDNATTDIASIESIAPEIGEESKSPSWKQTKTIQPDEKKFKCRMAGFLDNSFGISTAQHGVLNNTLDGGVTWTLSKNTSDCIAGLEIIDKNNAFVSANYSEVRVTSDGGAIWNRLPNFGDMKNEHCRYLSFIDPLTGWIANRKEVGFTSDGGKNWVNITVPENLTDINAIWLNTVNEGFILSSNGKLFITSNGGGTWSEKDLGITGLKVLVCPTTAFHVVDQNSFQIVTFRETATEKGYYFLSTIDGGDTWLLNDLIKEGGPGYIYLSRDGKELTITEDADKSIRVYESVAENK